MLEYLGLFFETPEQIIVLVACLLLWAGFAAVGGLILRGDRMIEADVISGWAVANLIFTVGGVFTPTPFTWMAAGFLVLAAMAIYLNMRDGERFIAPGFPRLVLLVLPLLLLASAMRGSQWDEFTDWLLVPRYLVHYDHFPSEAYTYFNATFPAYPFGWHYVTILVAKMTGAFRESAAPVFNVLLLMGLATLVIRVLKTTVAKDRISRHLTWPVVGLGAIAVTLLNPTFVQKVVVTSYADTSTAVVAAFSAVIGWMLVEALAVADYRRARRQAIQLGLALTVLINLKQATLALFLLLALAPFLVAWRDRLIPLKEIVRFAGYIIVLPLIVYFSWRYHVAHAIGGGEFSLRAIGDWHYGLIPQILGSMAIVLSKKGYYLACILIISALGIRAFLRCKTSEDRLFAIAAMAILGYNSFLFFAYLATFPAGESVAAASYWRYNHHLGGIVVVIMPYLAWRYLAPAIGSIIERKRFVAYLPLALVVAAPLLFVEKIRFDKVPQTVFYRSVGADVRNLLDENARIYVLDPQGSGESASIFMYETSGKQKYAGYHAAYHKGGVQQVRQNIKRSNADYLLVHSFTDELAAWIGAITSKDRSYLLKRDGDHWQVVKTWEWPAYRGKSFFLGKE